MSRREGTVAAPARSRVGLPILADGSARHPLLLRLPDGDAPEGACNNGCATCVTRAIQLDSSGFDVEVAGRHVVIRHREATLRRDLPAQILAWVVGVGSYRAGAGGLVPQRSVDILGVTAAWPVAMLALLATGVWFVVAVATASRRAELSPDTAP